MLLSVGIVALAAALPYAGAEALVRGAADLARVLGVSPLLVGLTVAAYGTSVPEESNSRRASASPRPAGPRAP